MHVLKTGQNYLAHKNHSDDKMCEKNKSTSTLIIDVNLFTLVRHFTINTVQMSAT